MRLHWDSLAGSPRLVVGGETVYIASMAVLFQILIPVSLLAVAVTLGFGIYALFRGGDFGRSYSNRLMRLRVVTQFVAVLVLVAAAWWRAHA